VKCPKCGFVSYAGLEKCKKCSYPFVKIAPKESSSTITSLFPAGVRAPKSAEPAPAPKESSRVEEMELSAPAEASHPAPLLEPQISTQRELPVLVSSRAKESSGNWRDEISKRVGNYRRRRARLQDGDTTEENLELEFEHSEGPKNEDFLHDVVQPLQSEERDFDAELATSTEFESHVPLADEPTALEESPDVAMQLDAPSAEDEEVSLGEPIETSHPMEIVVGSTEDAIYEDDEGAQGIFLAPLKRRMMAGLTDALVLLSGAALFAFIFWRVCGSLSFSPFNVAVLGMLAVLLIFSYFAVFTAIASATPGLLWMGCEVRNLRGEHPTLSESIWRAFGVLVSMSALMLGFIWAWVDSDSLTWHDRMSGTVITEEHAAPELSAVKAEA
jgi:uncharacterized RDD family membrane protein YckC